VQSKSKYGLGKLVAVFLMLGLILGLGGALPAVAVDIGGGAGGGVPVTLNLSKNTAMVGDTVTASGKNIPNDWVPLKVLDSDQNIVVFDATKSDAAGSYSINFIVPEGVKGNLTVIAGSGSKVATMTLTVTSLPSSGGGGGGGGGGASPAASTTGQATINPIAGGKVSLGSDASINIPAGALKGATSVNVTIQKVSEPQAFPAGFKLMGSVYEFKVGGSAEYTFNKPVSLTFSFDPASVPAGETPSVYYYDEASAQWVNLGGTVSNGTITLTINHFTCFAVLVKEAAGEPGTVTPDQPAPAQLFSDVPASHWAAGAIKELSEMGCISGYPDGTFKPESKITRAEFAVVLTKAYKMEIAAGKVFDDTAAHWAGDYIASAYAAGVISGYNDTNFGPDDPITREQMAVLIVKAAKISPAAGESQFADSGGISGWAEVAVAAAAENGIINGYPDNTFRPQGNATRAEAVTVIIKSLKK